MKNLAIVAAFVVASTIAHRAEAQMGLPMDENTPDLCSDGVDNDHNGQVDCLDPRCTSMPNCIAPGYKPLTLARPKPKQELLAGSLLILSGLALIGVSTGVIYETKTTRVLAQSPGYFFGASLAGSSVVMIALGIYYVKSGAHRQDRERQLGLKLSHLAVEPNIAVGQNGGAVTATLHF